MRESSQAAVRLIALVVMTALFVGLWANDRPESRMVQGDLPAADPLADTSSMHQLIRLATIVADQDENVAIQESQSLVITLGGISKTLSLETSGLSIPADILSRHIEQIPLGLAAGDYRIIDSDGGVGWLHVRVSGQETSLGAVPDLVTTRVNSADVRFIKVHSQTAANDPRNVR